MKKSELRQIIKEEIRNILKEDRNPLPPKNSNWYKFAKTFDIGILDLDKFASLMKDYNSFKDLDASISPKKLYLRNKAKFYDAIHKSSTKIKNLNLAFDEFIQFMNKIFSNH